VTSTTLLAHPRSCYATRDYERLGDENAPIEVPYRAGKSVFGWLSDMGGVAVAYGTSRLAPQASDCLAGRVQESEFVTVEVQ
jgi:hypothetical protein